MSDTSRPLSRRRFLGTAAVAGGALALPSMAGAQSMPDTVEFNPELEVILEGEGGEPVSHRLSEMLPWYFSPKRLEGGNDGR